MYLFAKGTGKDEPLEAVNESGDEEDDCMDDDDDDDDDDEEEVDEELADEEDGKKGGAAPAWRVDIVSGKGKEGVGEGREGGRGRERMVESARGWISAARNTIVNMTLAFVYLHLSPPSLRAGPTRRLWPRPTTSAG